MKLLHSNDWHSPPRVLPVNRLLVSLGLLSAAIISFQLALMQVLSIVQWHHFAYMIISVALLGFGAAGTVLAIFRHWLTRHIDSLLPALMVGCGIIMALVTDIAEWPFIRFDSYLLFSDYSHIGRLLLTYLLFFIPFFIGALAIGLIFDHYVASIGKIYFANLFGSGAGGLLILVLVWIFLPGRLPAVISFLPVIAGIMIIPVRHNHQKPSEDPGVITEVKQAGSGSRRKSMLSIFAVAALITCAWKSIFPPQLQLSQFKDLSKTLLLPDAEIKMTKTGPYGLEQAVTSPTLRYAPGLSLTAEHTANVNAVLFINGDWSGVITGYRNQHSSFILNYTSFDLPYIMALRKEVLVLEPGTGMDVAHALSNDAKKVVAVEPDAVLLASLKNELARANDSLFYDPAINIYNGDPRTFLASDTALYDLITMPPLGSFGGSSGLYALHEQFLLTREAFIEMWHRMKERGAISINVWMDYPARRPLKLLATLLEVLEEMNVQEPQYHIVAVRSWATISFVMTKARLTDQEIQNIRSFCERMQFDPALLPGLKTGERTAYHRMQDMNFFMDMDQLFSSRRGELYENYDFNIAPARDNQPYFSQFIKLKRLSHLAEFFGSRTIPFFEIGFLLVIITLIQITVVSAILILLPLFKIGWRGKNKLRTFLYFSGIGAGYMFVEMVFIQRLILYFGHPVYAASSVISSLLIFSGLGSYTSGILAGRKKTIVLILAAIVSLLLIYSYLFTPALHQTEHGSLPMKLLVVFLLIAPLAFCMGFPFPAGLHQVARTNPGEVPWAWGSNGCVSVISTALATIIAVEAGFTVAMLFATLAYFIALVMMGTWR